MYQGNVLARGARVAGGIILVVLIATEIIWIARDIGNAGVKDTFLTWIGRIFAGQGHAPLGTSITDLILLVVYLGALVAVTKPAAAGAFVTVGLLTFFYRLPLLWIMNEDITEGLPLRDRALYTALGAVIASVALIVIAAAGRRPAVSPADGEPPAPPRSGPAVFAGLLLTLFALAAVAWEAYYIDRFTSERMGPFSYWRQFSGQRPSGVLLAPPGFWIDWSTAVLCMVAAVQAFARKPMARPLGIVLGWVLAAYAVYTLNVYAKQELLFEFDDIGTPDILQQLTSLAEAAGGLVVIVLLALRGRQRPPVPGAWGAPGGQYGAWGTPPAPAPYNDAPYGRSPFGSPPPLPPEYPPNAPPRPQSPPGW
ncbi:hypothetical protein [Streptomyces sp. H39-S7]|uniref:hypothetical protein n=1 Tax=Streptomyces sp. H39-S7 TaxID=3004357 RepID=UPI0022AF9793|nr:hypothetical protein [Streptomyces sp. H39-S7]MCZ4120045.1 hypothetical protein [Streptomyces sp. H39-S7]